MCFYIVLEGTNDMINRFCHTILQYHICIYALRWENTIKDVLEKKISTFSKHVMGIPYHSRFSHSAVMVLKRTIAHHIPVHL